MTVTSLGNITIGAAVPGALAASVAGQAGINLALPDIQARLTALASFAPSLGDFSADIALAGQIIASINAAITAGITPPSLSAQVSLVAALIADLEAAVLSINAQLSIVLDFAALLGTAGVHAYHYTGRADQLGAGMTSELSSGFPGGAAGDSTNALILGTTSGTTWTAMSDVFKVAP